MSFFRRAWMSGARWRFDEFCGISSDLTPVLHAAFAVQTIRESPYIYVYESEEVLHGATPRLRRLISTVRYDGLRLARRQRSSRLREKKRKGGEDLISPLIITSTRVDDRGRESD